jgi:hypothetical protein
MFYIILNIKLLINLIIEMKSNLKTSLFGKFLKKSKFSSILKNKGQSTEDKSYSGTDSKHIYGSDRVNVDQAKKGLTTPVDDTLTHLKVRKISIRKIRSISRVLCYISIDQYFYYY